MLTNLPRHPEAGDAATQIKCHQRLSWRCQKLQLVFADTRRVLMRSQSGRWLKIQIFGDKIWFWFVIILYKLPGVVPLWWLCQPSVFTSQLILERKRGGVGDTYLSVISSNHLYQSDNIQGSISPGWEVV